MLELFRLIFAPPRDLILLLLAAWLGLLLADRRARASSVGERSFDAVALTMLVAFGLGGRVLFLAGHWAAFAASPASLFSLNRDLFDAWGGLAVALIAGAAVVQRRHLSIWQVLDLLSPLFAALSIGLALSHLASGAAFGREAHLPWSIQLWGAERHPTQVYELMAGLSVLGIVWFSRASLWPGGRFLLWLALAAASRLVIEGFRGDSTLMFGGLRIAQVIAWFVLALALLLLELLPLRRARAASEHTPITTH